MADFPARPSFVPYLCVRARACVLRCPAGIIITCKAIKSCIAGLERARVVIRLARKKVSKKLDLIVPNYVILKPQVDLLTPNPFSALGRPHRAGGTPLGPGRH